MNKTILDIALIEYQREFDRKTRLESKATGYLTIVSILLAASIGIFALSYPMCKNVQMRILTCFALFCECYFSLWAIGFALSSQRMRVLGNFDFSELEGEFYKEGNEELVFNTIKKMTKENISFNSSLEEAIDNSYMFVWITLAIFAIQFMISVCIILGG